MRHQVWQENETGELIDVVRKTPMYEGWMNEEIIDRSYFNLGPIVLCKFISFTSTSFFLRDFTYIGLL